MEIRPVGAELYHADGQKERHDKGNNCVLQFCERVSRIFTVQECAVCTMYLVGRSYFRVTVVIV